jgi:hypothetical protein
MVMGLSFSDGAEDYFEGARVVGHTEFCHLAFEKGHEQAYEFDQNSSVFTCRHDPSGVPQSSPRQSGGEERP